MEKQLHLYQIPMTQPNFFNNPILTPSQQNELQPIANNLIASQPQQNYNLPPLQPQLQPDNTVPSFVNNPNLSVQQKQAMLNAQPQQVVADVSPQSMAVAGANRQGIDWAGLLGNLGSYVAAAGSAYGTGANPSQGLLAATNALQKQTQNINQFDAMAPHLQQMGYDVSGYDPRRGGAGLTATPEKMIELQSLVDQREMNNLYRQELIKAEHEKAAQKQQATQTVGDLMLFNPEFRAMMNAQYDFRNGANAGILKRPVSKEALQNMMPKNVNMRYSGGITSRQVKTGRSDIYHHSNNTGGGGKKSGGSKKLIF